MVAELRPARREADGLGLADGQPGQRELRRDGRRGPARRERARAQRAAGDLGPGHRRPRVRCASTTPPTPRRGRYIWAQGQGGYYKHGIRAWWLDACEPELLPEQPEQPALLPRARARGRQHLPACCTREASTRGCAPRARTRSLSFAGPPGRAASGTGRRSGRATSTRRSRTCAAQIPAGLNIGISGIPWWTTDIGGFKDGDLSVRLVPRAHRPLVPVRRVLPAVPAARRPASPARMFGVGADRGAQRGLVVRRRGVRDHPPAARPAGAAAPLRDGRRCASATRPGLPPMRPLFLDFPADEPLLGHRGPVPVRRRHPGRAGGDRRRARARGVPARPGTRWLDAWTGDAHQRRPVADRAGAARHAFRSTCEPAAASSRSARRASASEDSGGAW